MLTSSRGAPPSPILVSSPAKGVSFSETITNSKQRYGKVLNAKEIEGMRKVCKVSAEECSPKL